MRVTCFLLTDIYGQDGDEVYLEALFVYIYIYMLCECVCVCVCIYVCACVRACACVCHLISPLFPDTHGQDRGG